MSTDGVLGAVLAADRRLPRPVRSSPTRSPTARAAAAAAILTQHARDRDRRRATGACAACAPSAGDIEAEVVVNAGGMFAAEIGRLAGRARAGRPDGPPVPGHPAVPRARPDEHAADAARPRPPVYFREEGGGLVMGGYERASRAVVARRRRASTRSRADFNGRLLEEDWDRFEEIIVNSRKRVPAMEDVTRHAADQRARGVHARQRVLPRRDRGARALRRRRLLRARARRRGRHRQGDGRVDRRRRAGARPLADGHPPLRRALPLAAPTRSRASREVYETYYDIHYPNHERQAGRPLRVSPAYAWHAGARRRVRREVGLGAGQLVRGQRGGGRRGAAPARLGRAATGRRRSAPSTRATPRGGGAVRRDLVREARGQRARARPRSRAAVRQPRRARGRARSPTRRCSTAAAGSSATSPSRGSPRTASGSSPAPRSAATTCAWIRRARRRGRRRAGRGRHLALGVLRRSGARGRATSSPPLHARPTSSFPYMTLREITVGDVPVRALRVTYVGELGWELYCPTEYGAALWRTLWEAGEPHGLVAGGYRAIDSLRLEKGYRVWGADITPDETPYEAGARLLRSSSTRATSSAARRSTARASRRAAAVLPRARRPALGRARQRAGARRRRDRGPRHHRRLRLHASSARSPTPTCPPSTPSRAPRSRSRSSASGSTARCAAEPLFDPRTAHACAARDRRRMSTADTKALIEEAVAQLPEGGAGARAAQARDRARAARPRRHPALPRRGARARRSRATSPPTPRSASRSRARTSTSSPARARSATGARRSSPAPSRPPGRPRSSS